jgi:hypothetical protein
MESCYLDTELTPVSRLWQCNVAHMKLEFKVRILYPVGIIEIEWHFDELLAKQPGCTKAVAHMLQNRLEAHHSFWRGRLIVDVNCRDVLVLTRFIAVQKESVGTT